jgi:hypothetical protein
MGGADGDTIAHPQHEKGLSALNTTHFPGSLGTAGATRQDVETDKVANACNAC